jgi:hypothetical protein
MNRQTKLNLEPNSKIDRLLIHGLHSQSISDLRNRIEAEKVLESWEL